MRALLPVLFLVLAATVTAQPADRALEIASLDRQLAALDREMARVESDLAAVRADLARIRAEERGLDADRARFQDEIRAFQDDADEVRRESDRVRTMYEYIRRTGGTRSDRQAYDRARYRLADEATRLDGQSRMLDDWSDEINAGYEEHAHRVRETAGLGQQLSARRSALYHQRETLRARRDRLAARGTGRTHTHTVTHRH